MFDSMHLICDAQEEWKLEFTEKIIPKVDPLLIGVKHVDHRTHVCLLAQFDLTFNEKLITREFTH